MTKYYMEEAVEIKANYKDFTGDDLMWRESYFVLLSYKNTYDCMFSMDLDITAGAVPVVVIVAKKHYAKSIVEKMGTLAYGNVTTEETKVVHVGSEELDDFMFVNDCWNWTL